MTENKNRTIVTVVGSILLVGVLFVAGFFGSRAVLGNDDDTVDTVETATSTVDTPDEDETPGDETVAAPAVDDTTQSEATDEPEVTTNEDGTQSVVIGQDEDGNDIVVTLEITEVCATTRHTELAGYPSHIEYLVDAPGLADGTEVRLQADGVNDGRVWTAEVRDGVIEFKGGVRSYGTYAFPSITWDESADAESTITADGEHVVDDSEGILNCVS